MTSSLDPLIGLAAAASLALVSYLVSLYFSEGRARRQAHRIRHRLRIQFWGYE